MIFFLGAIISGFIAPKFLSDNILWGTRNLTWEDFKALPVKNSPLKALSSCEVSYKSKFFANNDSIEFNVIATFFPEESWAKVEGESEKLLKHEQLHFDITELSARKLRKKLSESKFKITTVNVECKKISSEILQNNRLYQKQYDTETNHSTVEQKQSEWEKKVQKELEKLEKYKDNIVRIKFVK